MFANVTRFPVKLREVDPDATLCYLEFYARQLERKVANKVERHNIIIFAFSLLNIVSGNKTNK